jgi:hypothetical protein
MGKLLCLANATAMFLPISYQMPCIEAPRKAVISEGKSTGELGFERNFPKLVSHCSGVGNRCFSGRFSTNRTEGHCIGVGSTLPILLPNCYQHFRCFRNRQAFEWNQIRRIRRNELLRNCIRSVPIEPAPTVMREIAESNENSGD